MIGRAAFRSGITLWNTKIEFAGRLDWLRIDAKAPERRCTAFAQPAWTSRDGVGQKVQHHAFVVAHQADDAFGEIACQLPHPGQRLRAFRSVVNVVAQEDKLRAHRVRPADMRVDQTQQQFQKIGAPVDVTDDIGGAFRSWAIELFWRFRRIGGRLGTVLVTQK
jgi:hypothetical protein